MRLILNEHASYFDTLLQNNNYTYNHHRNILTLMDEIHKIKNNLNPSIMKKEITRIILKIFKSSLQKKKNPKNESWNFELKIPAIMVNFT